jgi:hypothetical protein
MFKRTLSFDRASVDVDAGTFDAVVFTGGEASDGHLLNVRGGEIPDTIPLFVNHSADPRTQLGTLHRLRSTDNEVVMRGEILTDGVGAEAEIRRDILLKMSRGHVARMSGRWDADESSTRRRASLPEDHPGHPPKDASSAQKFGSFFDTWRAMEGSVVGLGADQDATVRFAEDPDATEAVRGFWRELVEGDEAREQPLTPEADAPAAPVRGDLEAMAEAFEERIRMERLDIDSSLDALLNRIDELEEKLTDVAEVREEPANTEETEDLPCRVEERPRREELTIRSDFREQMRARGTADVRSHIDKKKGRLT